MMRNTITRTMATSTIYAYRLAVKDGKPEVESLEPLTIGGKATMKDAEKALRKVYGKDAALTVNKIDVAEDLYEISVEDFMKYAKKVEKKTEEPEPKAN